MFKETLRRIAREIVPPPPSKEMSDYALGLFSGTNPDVPTYGLGKKGSFDYYGKNREGSEVARFIIPWGELEKSFFIERTPEGKFIVTNEPLNPIS